MEHWLRHGTPSRIRSYECWLPPTNPLIVDNLLELIGKQTNTIKSEIYYCWGFITADYDDNKFIDCAVSAGVDYIITNDRHFDVLRTKNFPAVPCLTPAEFMSLLIN